MSARAVRLAALCSLCVTTACGGGGGGPEIQLTPDSVDLAVDAGAIARTIAFSSEFFDVLDCAVIEGLVDAPGVRRLMRFSTIVVNYGAKDLVVGDPAHPLPPFTAADFEWSPCHGHSHFDGWCDYSLENAQGQVVGFGHKQAFCLMDSIPYAGSAPSGGFHCEFQGISAGYGDAYPAGLDGQWVDITGVSSGTYTLVVTANTAGRVVEADDRFSNTARVPVLIPP